MSRSLLDNQHLGPGIVQDVLYVGGRVMGVKGHIDAAGLENTQQRGQEIGATLQI